MKYQLLPFEEAYLGLAYDQSSLGCFASGLGTADVFTSVIERFLATQKTKSFLIVLGTSVDDFNYATNLLSNDHASRFHFVTSDFSVTDRIRLYESGGAFCISSRICLVDLLLSRVPLQHLEKVVLLHVSDLTLESVELFILRLIREKNRSSDVQALTDYALPLVTGLYKLEQLLKALFISQLYLYPRFHVDVMASLDKHPLDIVEMQLTVTPLMMGCQQAVSDLIQLCIRQLKSDNPGLDLTGLTVESLAEHSVQRLLGHQLDAVWNELSQRTKQQFSELRLLRSLITKVPALDPVSYFSSISEIRHNKRLFSENTGWLFTESFDKLYTSAKSRLTCRSSKSTGKPAPEIPPKWLALKSIAEEIGPDRLGQCVVLSRSSETSAILRNLFLTGFQFDSVFETLTSPEQAKTAAERPSTDLPATSNQPAKKIKLTKPTTRGRPKKVQQKLSEMKFAKQNDKNDSQTQSTDVTANSPHYVSADMGFVGVTERIRSLGANFVVLYDPSLRLLRFLESLFAKQAANKSEQPGHKPFTTYLLMYTNSIEEQIYLGSVQREKSAFERLIREKVDLVLPESACADDDPRLRRDMSAPTMSLLKTAGVSSAATRPPPSSQEARENETNRRVVVDMREFRCQLPLLLYKRGIDVIPVTISVGDYVITPQVVLERKSVSDLIGSLQSGRLYSQVNAMFRTYERPCLLIEFDPKQFGLRRELLGDIQPMLASFLLHFKRLCVLWSPAPFVSARLIDEMKQSRQEPNVKATLEAESSSLTNDTAQTSAQTSTASFTAIKPVQRSLLLAADGLDSRLLPAVTSSFRSIVELAAAGRDQLASALKNKRAADQLFAFLHGSADLDSADAAQ